MFRRPEKSAIFKILAILPPNKEAALFFKYVIFDMDGLIIDSERLAFEVLRDHLREFGEDLSVDFFLELTGISDSESNELLKHRYKDLPFCLAEIKLEYARRVAAGMLKAKPGVFELLDKLEALGVRKCIGSSNIMEAIESNLNVVSLAGRFEFFVCDGVVELCKPSPDIFLKAAEMFCAPPSECLVLEDSLNGILAAEAAGCPVIMIPDLMTPTTEISQKCLGVYGSLLDVAELF